MSDDRELDRRGFLQALATVVAAPVVPLAVAPVVPLGPLVSSHYGAPMIGLLSRLYRLNQPILFIPGMRFEVKFQ